jgi:hypothetical protein
LRLRDVGEESVSHLRNSLDCARLAGVVRKSPTKLRDGPDQDVFADEYVGPNGLSKVLPGDNFSRFRGKGYQHLHNLRLEMNRFSVTLHAVDSWMNQPVPDAVIASQTSTSRADDKSNCGKLVVSEPSANQCWQTAYEPRENLGKMSRRVPRQLYAAADSVSAGIQLVTLNK